MLKGLTSTWKNGCNAKTLTFSEYIIIDNKKIPVKAVLKDDCYNNGNFIGTFIFKEISFEVENNIDFKRKEFEYYKVVNGEAIKFGTFITTEITDNDTTELVKVVGMDFGLKTQVEYMSSLDYSSGLITLLDVWNECCELSGLTSGITDFTNSDFIVESDQFTGTGATIRDVFVAIAQSSCSFVKVMNDDKIYLIFNEATQDVVEDYTDLDDKRDTKPITCVRLGMSQIVGENLDLKNDELVKKYGEHWLIINDNPFAYTQKKREELIYAILDKIKGFGYSAFSAKTSFKPYLTCGDIIKFKNKNGELINSILLRYEHNYDEITLEAPSETSATVNYVYPANAIDLYKKAEVKVNKEANNITFLTEQTKTLRENLTNGLNKANGTANDALQKANNGLSNVNVQYYLSTSNTTLSGGTWSDNAPSWVDGKYMWSRTKVTNAKGEVSYEPSINGTCIAGATGATGKDGINGKDGVNGKSITIKSKAIEYQASTSGTSAPTGTWTTTIPNVNKGSYLWTRTTVTYSDDTNTVSYSVAYRGTDGIDGTNGTNGTNGKDGKGITSITYYYATSTSQTAPSEANVTSTTIPTLNATNKYLWQKEVIKFSDNTNKTSILLIAVYGDKGQTGATGKGVKSIVEQYYLSSSNTTQTGGDWSNTQPNWVNGKYIWTKSHITWSDNTTTDTTPILANGLNKANSTANTANGNASTALNTVNNLSIGGRNLLLGTATATGDVSSGSGSLVENLDLFNGITGIKTNLAWQERCMNLKAVAKRGGFNVGDSLVASVYIKSDQDVNVDVSFHRSTGTGNISGSTKTYQNVTINNKWRQFWFPFVADEGSLERVDTRIEINKATGDNYIYWSGWKLEKGNKPTDWTPAPEDIDEDITTAQNTANKANSTATNAISMADSAKKDVQNTNENLTNNYYTISQTNELVQTAEDGLVNAYTTTGGANIFVNTGLWFVNDNNDQNVNPYEDWKGKALRKSNDEASNGNSILLQNGTFEQEQEVPNGNYSISFMYKKLISQSVASVVINGKEYQLNSTTLKEFYTGEKNEKNEYITEPIVVTAGHLKIQFKCNANGGVEIYDLMANKGSIKLAYSQNQNETTTETVKISKGITITSTNMETIFKANANGIRILSLQNEKIAYFTDKGLSTKELTVENKAQMCSTLISEVGDQTWLTRM